MRLNTIKSFNGNEIENCEQRRRSKRNSKLEAIRVMLKQ